MSPAAHLRDLEEAVTASFRAHEHLADPRAAERMAEHARQQAGPTRGRGLTRAAWLAAAAGVVGVIVLGTSQIRGADDAARGPAASQATEHPSTTAENLRAARAEVDRLLALVPPLPGSVRDDVPPLAAFAELVPVGRAASDRLVVREVYLRAPGDLEEGARFYEKAAAPPLAASRAWGAGPGRSEPTSMTVTYVPTPAARDAAFVAPGVDIDLIPIAAGVAVRVRAHALARPGRIEGGFVTGEVTSIDVRPTIASAELAPASRPTARPAITDPAAIAEIVDTLNTLRMAAPVRDVTRGCPPGTAGMQTGARLTLHRRGERDIVVEADWSCVEVISIDGRPALEPDSRWAAIKARLKG